MAYNYDIVVIGGGPGGYAAAIRAGQLKKRVLCVEKENLGGTCLNWGCIPTKALLESGAFVRRLRERPGEWGVSFENLKVDFPAIIARSRGIAGKLSKGIAHLFNKYDVKHEMGVGQLLGAHRVRVSTKEGIKDVTAEHVVLATGRGRKRCRGWSLMGRKSSRRGRRWCLARSRSGWRLSGRGRLGVSLRIFIMRSGRTWRSWR